MMSISEALNVAETVEIEIEHGYKANREQQALVALYRQVKKTNAERSRT